MAKLDSDVNRANDRLTLAVWACFLGIGIPISYAAYAFWPDLDIPYCRSSQTGTAPAAIYFLAMNFFVVPLLVARNRNRHQEHAKKAVDGLASSTGLTLLLSCVSLVLFLLPFLLTCGSYGQYGRASLVTRALKGSWWSLSFAGPVLALGTYLAAVILFVYIPSVRGRFKSHGKAP